MYLFLRFLPFLNALFCNFSLQLLYLQAVTRVKPFICTMPLKLDEGWNQIQLNLTDLTRRAYGTNYVETLRVQVHANCRLRRIYFSDRLYSEEELPPEFKLYLPMQPVKLYYVFGSYDSHDFTVHDFRHRAHRSMFSHLQKVWELWWILCLIHGAGEQVCHSCLRVLVCAVICSASRFWNLFLVGLYGCWSICLL